MSWPSCTDCGNVLNMWLMFIIHNDFKQLTCLIASTVCFSTLYLKSGFTMNGLTVFSTLYVCGKRNRRGAEVRESCSCTQRDCWFSAYLPACLLWILHILQTNHMKLQQVSSSENECCSAFRINAVCTEALSHSGPLSVIGRISGIKNMSCMFPVTVSCVFLLSPSLGVGVGPLSLPVSSVALAAHLPCSQCLPVCS